eukprot:tig00000282_g23853.t1
MRGELSISFHPGLVKLHVKRQPYLEEEGRTEWPAAEIAAAGPENIRALDLDGNMLTRIPGAELAKLTNLEVLYLRNNQLTALPPEIGRLAALKILSVDNNRLTALPPEIGCLAALRELYVRDNQLTALPPEIGRIAALRELWVHGNPVVDSWPEPVRRAVNDNSGLFGGEAQCAAVVPYLRSLPAPAPAPAAAAPRPAAPAPRAPPAPAPPQAAPRPPPAGDVRSWSEDDVVAWVRSRGPLAQFAGAFQFTNGVALLALGHKDLEEMGVAHHGARHRLLAEIATLGHPALAPGHSPTPGYNNPAQRVPPLPPGYEYHVFITYRRLGGRNYLASLVREALEKRGYRVFFDTQSLQGGVFDSAILHSLRASCVDVFILVDGTLERCKDLEDWRKAAARGELEAPGPPAP